MSLLKTFYYNNKDNRKVKHFQKLFNKEIYFILSSNSTKYNVPFEFISWPNFLEGHNIPSLEIWGKTFTDWFKKGLLDIFFLTPQYTESATHQIFCVLDVKNSLTLSVILSLYCY